MLILEQFNKLILQQIQIDKAGNTRIRELEESIRMLNSQRGDVGKINLIEEGKKQALMKLLSAMNLLTTV